MAKKTFNRSGFESYDAENPEIWSAFKEFTFQLIDRGVKHYGAKAIFEAIRYHITIEKRDGDFKLNNNFTANYARKFLTLFPRHAGFFEIRDSPKKRQQKASDRPIPAADRPLGQVSTLKQAARIMGAAAHKKTKQPAGQKNFAWGKQ